MKLCNINLKTENKEICADWNIEENMSVLEKWGSINTRENDQIHAKNFYEKKKSSN